MLAEIILFLALGILAGTFTGLIPGIHMNLVGVTLISVYASILSGLNPLFLAVFITSMAMSHTFIDFIPSVFLGCPDTDTELSVLPGHELLKKGGGFEAVSLTAYGSLAAVFLLFLIVFPSFFLVPKINDFLLKSIELSPSLSISFMPILLILVSFLLIFMEEKKQAGFLVFLISGALGLSVLNIDFLKEPLLPLLTGLFGSSMIILSIRAKTKIPPQEISKPELKGNLLRPLFGSLLASPLSSMLPGLGSGQAAIIGNTLTGRKDNRKGFLVLLGATNTLVMGFSFIALYLIGRTRTGAAVAINDLIGGFSWQVLTVMLVMVLISGIISFFLTIKTGKIFSTKLPKINYLKISLSVLVLLTIIVFLVSGFFGLIVLVISTITGIFCINTRARRTQMMSCLLVPTIVFYLML